MNDKALFIPLMAKYYDAFIRGDKDTEYRLHGKRWNLKTCYSGRQVILSRGYGKQNRVTGAIEDVYVAPSQALPGLLKLSLREIYGDISTSDIIFIKIAINN